MGQKGPKAMPTPSLFKMKYQNNGGAEALMKALVGDQHRLPDHLKKAIEAAPETPKKDKAVKSYGPKDKTLMLDDPKEVKLKEVVVTAPSYKTLESRIKQAANKYKNKELANTSNAIYEAAKGNINISDMSKEERDYIQKELSGVVGGGDFPEFSLQTFGRMQQARQDRALGK